MFLVSKKVHAFYTFLAILVGITAASGVQSQPTGNPKGTTMPPETAAPKAGSNSKQMQPSLSGAEGGKLVGNEAQTRARMQNSIPPGSGTEGGLTTKRQGATGGNGSPSDKGSASPRPVSPTR